MQKSAPEVLDIMQQSGLRNVKNLGLVALRAVTVSRFQLKQAVAYLVYMHAQTQIVG